MSSALAHSGLSKCEAWESVQGLWKPRGDPFCVIGFVLGEETPQPSSPLLRVRVGV